VRFARDNHSLYGIHSLADGQAIQGQAQNGNRVLRFVLHLKLPFPLACLTSSPAGSASRKASSSALLH
jgi:hypothetical protein